MLTAPRKRPYDSGAADRLPRLAANDTADRLLPNAILLRHCHWHGTGRVRMAYGQHLCGRQLRHTVRLTARHPLWVGVLTMTQSGRHPGSAGLCGMPPALHLVSGVVRMSANHEVRRVYARRVVTCVTHDHPWRDWADCDVVNQGMHPPMAPRPSYGAVALGVPRTGELPAPVVAVGSVCFRVHERNSFSRRESMARHRTLISTIASTSTERRRNVRLRLRFERHWPPHLGK